jgi:hypothetical protein
VSEYQYYEFAAIDRPLSRAEMAQLRAVSTRAEITSAGFVNHYEWGDLKADPADWMRRYFDAFVYTANWCSCRLSLRLPTGTFSKSDLRPFATERTLAIEAGKTHWIINWSLDESEDHERFAMDDGHGWMRRLAPLRDELLRGDMRALYLGWLAAADALDDDDLEPPTPPGLGSLSPPQQALAEFLEVDPDMLAAACAGSEEATAPDAQVDQWLATWSREEMAALLKLLARGQGQQAERHVKSRHAAWLKAHRPTPTPSAQRRCLVQLRQLAQTASVTRRQREAQERAVQDTERRRQREAQLRRLMADVDKCWAAVEAQALRGSASGYEQAVRALKALAEGYALTASREAFDRALRRWLAPHAKRGALMRRLAEAGLQ